MSSNPTPIRQNFLVRFFDNFLQERNIKWMLVVGMMILLASSLLLVSAHWTTCTPVWKYLIFLSYTVAIVLVGDWTGRRLGLRRTGTMLQGLTVLLVPISFLVLRWVRGDTGPTEPLQHLVLLGINIAFSVVATQRVFHHFLRGNQPTFLISFLLLSLAGAVVPGLPEAWAPWTALALWTVFAVGSVKVNRHVFWLTEEHRAPRIFGFFPILLLGSQFFLLFALHAPNQIGLDWLGLGLVLTAIPILLTADGVAKVFQQRTGDLVRPLPWAIIAPMGLGLLLCACGVCLAATSLTPPFRTHALVLASALAAGMMAVVARRTNKSAFVWVMLPSVVIAYNFLPSFFIDVARAILAQAAHSVQEARLPYAYNGLTYLPLLLTLMAAGAWLTRKDNELFALPIRRFAMALGCLMLAVSLGHVKALFPVALCMTAAFALQVIRFREGRLAALGILAWMMASVGFVPFAEQVLGWTMPGQAEIAFLTAGAAVLLLAGRFLDERISRLISENFHRQSDAYVPNVWRTLCQNVSLVVTFGLAGYWLVQFPRQPLEFASWPGPLAVSLLLLVQAWRNPGAIRWSCMLLINWQILSMTVLVFGPPLHTLQQLGRMDVLPFCLPLALVSMGSILAWQALGKTEHGFWRALVAWHLSALRILAIVAMVATLQQPVMTPIELALASLFFTLAIAAELIAACRQQAEERVWIAEGIALLAVGYFVCFGVIVLGQGLSMFIILGVGVLAWAVGQMASAHKTLGVLTTPLQTTALILPMATVALGLHHHVFQKPVWLGANSLALLLASSFYFWRGLERAHKPTLLLSGAILNVALVLLWRELVWTDPQFFMIPIGISILGLVQFLKQEIPEKYHDPLRYLGALVILVSPTFHIVDGSWIHLFSLMAVSVGIVLLAIGIRVRALMYAGTAFLVADLVAMVVRGSIDNPNVLWMAGLSLGAAVITLGAFCERNREVMLDRVRVLSDALKQWE